MATYKLIKSTAWTASNGNTGTTLVLGYKGRVMTCNQADFTKITVATDTVTISEDVELVQTTYTDGLGVAQKGLKLMPKLDIMLADI
jgi:hypothetical protein